MFGIGIMELFIVLLVALFVIGPDKLPEVGRTMGRMMRKLRRFTSEIQSHVWADDEEDIPHLHRLDNMEELDPFAKPKKASKK